MCERRIPAAAAAIVAIYRQPPHPVGDQLGGRDQNPTLAGIVANRALFFPRVPSVLERMFFTVKESTLSNTGKSHEFILHQGAETFLDQVGDLGHYVQFNAAWFIKFRCPGDPI